MKDAVEVGFFDSAFLTWPIENKSHFSEWLFYAWNI